MRVIPIVAVLLSTVALAAPIANLEPITPSPPIVNVESLSITISISRTGDANVTEDYRLSFGDDASFQAYQSVRDSGAKTLAAWRNLTSKISQNILGGEVLVTSQRASGFEHVILAYSSEGLAKQIGTQGKYAVLSVDSGAFTGFSESNSTALLIPEKVTINIKVEDPRKSKEEQVSAIFEVSPPGLLLGPFEQEGTIVFLANGPLTANDFSLKMKVERTLSESLSIQSIVRFLTQNPVYGAALAALVVLMIVFRKQVFGALSEIAGEEDIQPPKREV